MSVCVRVFLAVSGCVWFSSIAYAHLWPRSRRRRLVHYGELRRPAMPNRCTQSIATWRTTGAAVCFCLRTAPSTVGGLRVCLPILLHKCFFYVLCVCVRCHFRAFGAVSCLAPICYTVHARWRASVCVFVCMCAEKPFRGYGRISSRINYACATPSNQREHN